MRKLSFKYVKIVINPRSAVVAEWLRRLTRNQIPSGSVGSNPTDCETLAFCGQDVPSRVAALQQVLR